VEFCKPLTEFCLETVLRDVMRASGVLALGGYQRPSIDRLGN
jgi:hypothetical protein